ncbi:MAG: tetratricopeptide repeat protein [Chitinivibrionales bacterium]|nr:tetratricopeptide repeat protein [Chitinivibrionales bacterium]
MKYKAAPLLQIGALITSLLLTECAVSRFPVVQPAHNPTRESLAKARAEIYFIKARDYDRRGLHQMAGKYYENAYELDPQSDELRKLLIRKHLVTGKFTNALFLLKRGRSLQDLDEEEKRLLARVYMRLSQYERSAEVLSKLNSLNDDEIQTLALIYETMGNASRAIRFYTKYQQRHPESISTGLKIADIYKKNRQYEQAESIYVALGKIHAGNPQIINGLGAIKLLQGDTALALDFFNTASLMDSTYNESMQNAAQVYISRGEFKEAIDIYEKLSSTEEHGEVYLNSLALLYYYDNQYDKSERLIRSLLQKDMNDSELHFYLGLVFAAQDRQHLARVEYEKALAIKPEYVDAWRQLCYLYIKNKDYAQALQSTQRFTANQPDRGISWRLLGSVHNMRKEFRKAEKALLKSLELDSSDAYAWFELGSARERRQDIAGATRAFRKVLAFQPEDAATANYLGYMWAENDINLDSAKTLLESALAQDPQNGAYLDSYGWIFYKKKDYDNALVFISKALEHIEDDPIIWEHLGEIYEKKGSLREALHAFRKSYELGPEAPHKIQSRILQLENDLLLLMKNDENDENEY